MIRTRMFVAAVTVGLALGIVLQKGAAAEPYAGVDPYWVLVHEQSVLDDLKLTADQTKQVRDALDPLDAQFFRLRNRPPQEAASGVATLAAQAKTVLAKIFTAEQSARVRQISLRRAGTTALAEDPAFAAELKLTAPQQEAIKKILEESKALLKSVEAEIAAGKPRAPLEQQWTQIKTDEQKKIIALLEKQQLEGWRAAVGQDFDTAQLGWPRYRAPELIDSGEWINSPPLALSKLRGKVIVVHFFAANCINCIHNYPTYRDWTARFAGQDVAILGIHTPETSDERVVANVRRKAAADKLAFPILIDGESKNWAAWGNSMWPTVYVVDKQGYFRDFWQGELKWEGATGDAYIQGRVAELLAEKAP